MKKLIKSGKIILYSLLLYLMTVLFVSFFTLSAEAIREWKRNDIVSVFPDKIDLNGNRMLTKKEIILIMGLENKKSWFDIDERKMESYLLSSGWVKRAFVKKLFPDSVKVVIEEFVPAIVVNSKRSVKKGDGEKDVYSLWFADSEGIVFKRAFPGETTSALPFFHINNDSLTEKMRGEKIITAVKISNAWKNPSSSCEIKSIRFDVSSGFTADCESHDSMTTFLSFGSDFLNSEIEYMRDKFSAISAELSKKNEWAGEYIFEKTDNKIRVISGKKFLKM